MWQGLKLEHLSKNLGERAPAHVLELSISVICCIVKGNPLFKLLTFLFL